MARVSLPGGCAIGARPVNLHLAGFEHFGVTTKVTSGYIEAKAETSMQGNTIYFDTPTVTGTENVLMAAIVAQGTTIIKNAAREPEVGNLIDMLCRMGAKIEGCDSDRLTIHGVEPHQLQPAEVDIIPDRIETGTYLLAVGAAGGEVRITGCNPTHLPSLIEKARKVGIIVQEEEKALLVYAAVPNGSEDRLRAVDIRTMPYPGFPTDLQAQFMALLTLTRGSAIVHETIFENRFMHVAELQRMGADITIDGSSAVIRGKGDGSLSGAQVMATDLRASASLVIAALAANGRTDVSRIYHLERGYEHMAEKLSRLGADVLKVRE
jgi:UDP-N-acetylglucosamine 1-carboxyvinyltransferase